MNTTSPPTIAVIDFETTGMSPAQGARATELGVVLLQGGRIVERYQSLMHTGTWVPPFIEQLTGISNTMLAKAPPAATVMREVAELTRGCVGLVAHNAAFDRGFWAHEWVQAGLPATVPTPSDFACTLLLSRRLYPEAPNHRLGTLASHHGIRPTGRAHRALADAEMAAELWLRIEHDVQRQFSADTPFGLLCALQRAPKGGLARAAARYFGASPAATPSPRA